MSKLKAFSVFFGKFRLLFSTSGLDFYSFVCRLRLFFFFYPLSFSSVVIFWHLMNKKWRKWPLFIPQTLRQKKKGKKIKCGSFGFSRLFQVETGTHEGLLKADQLRQPRMILRFLDLSESLTTGSMKRTLDHWTDDPDLSVSAVSWVRSDTQWEKRRNFQRLPHPTLS